MTFNLEQYNREQAFKTKINAICFEIEANAREIKTELQKPRAASIKMNSYLLAHRISLYAK